MSFLQASYETPAQFVTVYKHIHHILVSELLLLQENGLLQNPTQASQPNLQVLVRRWLQTYLT